MEVLFIGKNQSSSQYMKALQNEKKVRKMGVLHKGKALEETMDKVIPLIDVSELETSIQPDLVIVSDYYENISTWINHIFSLPIPIIWDTQYLYDRKHMASLTEQIQDKKAQLHLSNPYRFDPQMMDVFQNINKGRIGQLGVANMKRYASEFENHEKELQREIESLTPYIHLLKSVFAMERIYDSNQYMTLILRLKTGSIINLEVYTGQVDFHRSGEFSGREGVLDYSTDLQTMEFKSTKGETKKWTPSQLNMYIKMVDHFLATDLNQEQAEKSINTHKQLLNIHKAIKRSLQEEAPISLEGGPNE